MHFKCWSAVNADLIEKETFGHRYEGNEAYATWVSVRRHFQVEGRANAKALRNNQEHCAGVEWVEEVTGDKVRVASRMKEMSPSSCPNLVPL